MDDCAWVFREALRGGRYVQLTYKAPPERGGLLTTRIIVVRGVDDRYIYALYQHKHRLFRLDRVKGAQLI